MPKYVIERELPGAGRLSAEELGGIAKKSNHVIGELGPEIRWLTSYVTEDKIYCVYVAPDEDILFEHARCDAREQDEHAPGSILRDHPGTAQIEHVSDGGQVDPVMQKRRVGILKLEPGGDQLGGRRPGGRSRG